VLVKPTTLIAGVAPKLSEYSFGQTISPILKFPMLSDEFLSVGGDMTIEWWAKKLALNIAEGVASSGYDDGTYQDTFYALYQFHAATAAASWVDIATENSSFLADQVRWNNVPNDGWHHFAYIYRWGAASSAARHSLIVDGVNWDANQTVVTNRTGNMLQLSTADSAATVAWCPWGFSTQNALIDEWRLWTVERTPAEVAADMRKVLDPATPNLKRYFRLENNILDSVASPTTVTCSSPNYSTDTPF
jgi:hypothetical protein